MKHRLCVLLILVQGPVVAGQVTQSAPPQNLIDSGQVSPFEAVPRLDPAGVKGDGRQSLPGNIGIFTTDVVFPVPLRHAVRPAPAGAPLSGAIVKEFPYRPADYAASSVNSGPAEGSVTMLEPIRVLGNRDRETAEAIDALKKFREAEAFHPASGGRLASFSMGGINIEMGLWQHQSLISESPHVGIQRLVIDLVRVRW